MQGAPSWPSEAQDNPRATSPSRVSSLDDDSLLKQKSNATILCHNHAMTAPRSPKAPGVSLPMYRASTKAVKCWPPHAKPSALALARTHLHHHRTTESAHRTFAEPPTPAPSHRRTNAPYSLSRSRRRPNGFECCIRGS